MTDKTKHCPDCGGRWPAQLLMCPEDGTDLEAGPPPVPVTTTVKVVDAATDAARSGAPLGVGAIPVSGSAAQPGTRFEPTAPRYAVVLGGDRFHVDPPSGLMIGRQPEFSTATALQPHNNVSRIHCRLTVDDGVLVVEDLESTNGTYVDGARIAPNRKVRLAPGAALRLASDVMVPVIREVAQ